MQVLADFIPTKHILLALRQAILNNATVGDIAPQLLIMTILTVILLPIGIIALIISLNKTLKKGSLLQF